MEPFFSEEAITVVGMPDPNDEVVGFTETVMAKLLEHSIGVGSSLSVRRRDDGEFETDVDGKTKVFKQSVSFSYAPPLTEEKLEALRTAMLAYLDVLQAGVTPGRKLSLDGISGCQQAHFDRDAQGQIIGVDDQNLRPQGLEFQLTLHTPLTRERRDAGRRVMQYWLNHFEDHMGALPEKAP